MPVTLSVLLTAEGTYPVTQGGVSTWCDQLIRYTKDIAYTVLTIMANPYQAPIFDLLPAVTRWVPVPLWGTDRPGIAHRSQRLPSPPPAVIHEQLLPALARLTTHIWHPTPATGQEGGDDFVILHELFMRYDYNGLLKHPQVWQWYLHQHTTSISPASISPTLQDLIQSLGWLYRFLAVLAIPIPDAQVVHASAASFCALPGIVAKRSRSIPLLLTEHGVYLREQYNSAGRASLSPFLRRWWVGLVQVVTRAAYAAADVVAPVAAFNTRWEREFGVEADRIMVIYNGVNPAVCKPRPRPEGAPPTVVSVARIDPVKDLVTLMQSAALAIRAMPDLHYVVYGGVSVPAYQQHLLALRSELGLEERFTFAGHTSDIASAYTSGDIVALSSISEGFPYAAIEAMMCGRTMVATDVGGTSEALGDTGIMVPARNPQAMADATLRLLQDRSRAAEMGAKARTRALDLFTTERFAATYQNLYHRLAGLEPIAERDALDHTEKGGLLHD